MAQQQTINDKETLAFCQSEKFSLGESRQSEMPDRDSEFDPNATNRNSYMPSDILITFMPGDESAKPSINRANFRDSVRSMVNRESERLTPEDLAPSVQKMTGRWANEVLPFAEKISMKLSTRLGLGQTMNKESIALIP
jgi:hypothetical protein